ncbi:MAG: hypothetical protein ACI30R_01125 [Sodaliphilus sp.]
MKNRVKMSTIVPVLLAIYLAVMAWVGRERLESGEYFYYFGVIGLCMMIIVITHFVLKKKEYYRQKRREEAEYGTYEEDSSEEKDAEASADASDSEK